MALAIALGAILAAAALAFVLTPLVRAWGDSTRPSSPRPSRPADEDDEDPVAALREVEFDRETGKLSDADYATLRSRYTAQALDRMRAAAASPVAAALPADAEAAIRRYRDARAMCADCGPRPEAGAVFCSSCGRYLAGRCVHCGCAVRELGASWCSACGGTLAAA